MPYRVRYRSPSGAGVQTHDLVSTLVVGRDPGDGGVTLLPADDVVSARALALILDGEQLCVRNTSSFAQIDVHHAQGVRFLFPGEELRTRAAVVISIPSETYTHSVEVDYSGVDRPSEPIGTTRPVGPSDVRVAAERFPALVALCAAKFFPDRYGTALLTATDIALLLERRAHRVTPKAVNNKLQRLRLELNERHGTFLESREDLAEFAVKNRLVTRGDVVRLFH